MKTIKKLKVTIVAMSIIAAFGAATVHAHDRQNHPMRAVLKQLDLTEQQRQNVRINMQKTRLEAKIYRQDMKAVKEQLSAVIRSSQWDEQLASQLIQQKQDIHANVALTRASSKHNLWHTLDGAQQQKFDELVQDKKSKRGQRKAMRRFGPLNLSEQQKSDIEALFAAQKEQRLSMKPEMKSFKQSQALLIKGEEFDQDAWLDAFKQMQQTQLTLAVANAHTRHQIWNLLDEDQKAKLVKMEKKRAKKANKKRRNQQEV